jgi:hypothetical protein
MDTETLAMQIDLNALAYFVETTLDCSPEFEDDQFAFSFQEARIFCTRKCSHFVLEVQGQKLELPRP